MIKAANFINYNIYRVPTNVHSHSFNRRTAADMVIKVLAMYFKVAIGYEKDRLQNYLGENDRSSFLILKTVG